MSASPPSASRFRLLPDRYDDPVAAVRAGLPYEAYERVRDALHASDDLLARALTISTRTLNRRKKQGQFTTEESDRLLIVAQIAELATDAFDSKEAARAWLQSPHELLGGESPLERMDTLAGVDEVRTMLYHIEYSMPL